MQQRSLGASAIGLSSIGLGTWAIGGHMWGGQDDTKSLAAIEAAIDHGINWIDTAPIYGSGHSETIVGRALRAIPGSRRPMVFTKFGLGVNADAPSRSASGADVIAECDASLGRLGVDRIDLYQLHWPAPQPIPETAAACAKLLDTGKVRAIGVSNFSVAELEAWRATGVPLTSLQAPYSILRPAVAADQVPWCQAHGVGVIAYSPLFRGMLFGTWGKDKTFPAGDGRGTHKDYLGARFQRHLQAIDEIKTLASAAGLSCGQLCIGVLLRTPGVNGCIVGARDAQQAGVMANLGVSVTEELAKGVWEIVRRLREDLETM